MNILTITCWSHAIRYHLFSWELRTVLAVGTVERLGLGSSFVSQRVPGRELFCLEAEYIDHRSAVALIIASLSDPQQGVIADAG